jgi:hypothetical protein
MNRSAGVPAGFQPAHTKVGEDAGASERQRQPQGMKLSQACGGGGGGPKVF